MLYSPLKPNTRTTISSCWPTSPSQTFILQVNPNRSPSFGSNITNAAYGIVLRMQADLLVKNNNEPHSSKDGEWGPLEYTNWCLGTLFLALYICNPYLIDHCSGNRFGSRRRPYVSHTAKAVSLSLLEEFSVMWHSELTVTASHAFRGMEDGHRDMYSLFLFSHSIVERWREGLLWSWAVAKLGGMHDEWLPADSERAWHDIGGQPGVSVVEVMMTKRRTVRKDVISDNLGAAGHVFSGKTEYAFGKCGRTKNP
jgi:Stealth protein CR3, conserved region 3